MAKESAVPTDTRDKVGVPDPWLDFLALLLDAGRNPKNADTDFTIFDRLLRR